VPADYGGVVFDVPLARVHLSHPGAVGSFLKFFDPEHPAECQQVLFLAGRRARRSYAPQALVFAVCEEDELVTVSDNQEYSVKFVAREGAAMFQFWSVWTLAKTFLLCGCTSLAVESGSLLRLSRCTQDPGGFNMVVAWQSEAVF
jgi:hypothetical protein